MAAPGGDSARALTFAALDREAEFATEEALRFLRAATEQDPAYVAGHWLYIRTSLREGRRSSLLRRYGQLAATSSEMACYALAAERPNSGAASELPRVYALVRATGIGPCATVLLAEMIPYGREVPGLPPTLELRRRAVDIAGELASPWVALALDMKFRGDSARADSVVDAALARLRHPLQRIPVLALRASRAGHRGRNDIAVARWRAIAAAAERDGRPGVVLTYRSHRAQLDPGFKSARDIAERMAIARRASVGTRFSLVSELAAYHALAGDFAASLPHFERTRLLADSLPDRSSSVDARLWLGRALSKAGRAGEAEHMLRDALRVADGLNLPYTTAEIWHNLAHAYEGSGKAVLAIAAGDSFVAHAAVLDRDPIRIMSRRDAGMLRLALGWHAAAHAQFDAMVRLISAERQNNYWAGEYYERVGNTRAALTFFQRGLAHDHGERSLNLAGLVRVYEALGMADSVAASARDHDRFINSVTEVPLTPEVLSRAGRHREALDLSRQWARRREAAANVHGAALARLQAARLALAAGDLAGAREDARRAERHAATLRLPSELVEALRVQGVAEARMATARNNPRQRADAVRLLARAANAASRLGDVRLVRETNLALGDAHGDASANALAAYDAAARAVESATISMSDDVDRARYRSAHMAPFDAAVHALVRHHAGGSLEPLSQWSARRKAATLALATRDRRISPSPFAAGALRGRLAPDEAVVDYMVVKGIVAALVVRPDTMRLVELPVSSDTLETLARRMTAHFARRGGRVDMARLAFDENAATRLHRALIAPLRGSLDGVDRLTVIADGAIHHVPFAALVDGTRHLLDEFELDYAPSLSLVGQGASSTWKGAPLLLVRTDVPGALRERDSIRRAWGGAMTELANGAATEQAVVGAVPRSQIIHFATHAEADDRNPLLTHLRLSPDRSGDGMLHLAEIASARFTRRLVVLAACESTAGELLTGEGFMGLSRAFLAAGALGVVATRWAVDSSAADFSAAFYTALAEGRTVASATRSAQLALRDRPSTAHPFFWAGYVAVRAGGF